MRESDKWENERGDKWKNGRESDKWENERKS